MKWEFSTSYQGLGSKSPTVQRQLKQKGSRVIIEFDKVLSHSIILPPRLSKIILVNAHRASRQKYLEICQRLTYGLGFPSAIPGPSRRPRLGKSMVKYGAIWCNIVKLSTVQLPCTSTVHEYLRTRGPVSPQCSTRSTQKQKEKIETYNSSQKQTYLESVLFTTQDTPHRVLCPAQIQCCTYAKLSVNKHDQ